MSKYPGLFSLVFSRELCYLSPMNLDGFKCCSDSKEPRRWGISSRVHGLFACLGTNTSHLLSGVQKILKSYLVKELLAVLSHLGMFATGFQRPGRWNPVANIRGTKAQRRQDGNIDYRAGSCLLEPQSKGFNAQRHKTRYLSMSTLCLRAFVSLVLKTHSLPALTQPGCLNLNFQD